MLELESVCITCFQQPETGKFLSGQTEKNSAVADILRKHFWFTDSDLQRAMVCHSCWDRVLNFHNFYTSVEGLHHARSVAILVKSEPYLDSSLLEPVENKVDIEPTDSGTNEPVPADAELVDDECKTVNQGEESIPKKKIKYGHRKTGESIQIDEELIREHVRYICEQCGLESMSFMMFSKHAREMHDNKSASLQCCGRKFFRKIRLFEHVVAVNHPEMFRCDQCNLNYSTRDTLRVHMSKHRNGQIKDKQQLSQQGRIDVQLKKAENEKLPETQPDLTASANNIGNVSQDGYNLAEAKGKQSNDEETVRDVAQTITPNTKLVSRVPKTLGQRQDDDQFIRKHVKYICEQCKYESTTFAQFLKHAHEKHNQSSAHLMCCGTKFYRKSRLLEHVLAVNNPDIFRCNQCQKSFSYKTGLLGHMKQFHSFGERPRTKEINFAIIRKREDEFIREHVKYICNPCRREFPSFALLRKHSADEHSLEEFFLVCCGQRYLNKVRLLEHVTEVDNSADNLCVPCSTKLKSSKALRNHIRRYHGMLQQQPFYQQELFDARRQTSDGNDLVSVIVKSEPRLEDDRSELAAGETTIIMEPQENFETDEEDDESNQESEFNQFNVEENDQHDLAVKRMFEERQQRLDYSRDVDAYIRNHVQYLCEECGLESETFTGFSKHAQGVHGNKSVFLNCCGKRFYKRIRLLEHVQVLNNPVVFRCDRCDKNFKYKKGLLLHKKEFHSADVAEKDPNEAQDTATSITPAQEKKCFEQNQKVEKYIKRHVKYQCEQCGQESKSFNHFLKHKQEIHEDHSAYLTCCGKKYYRRTRLLEHVQVIDNPEMFRCERCEKNFNNKLALLVHTKEFHSGNVAQDVIINRIYAQRQKRLKQSRQDEEYIKRHVKYQCEECGLENKTFKNFTKHKIQFHGNTSAFLTCCGKRYYRRVRLLEHVQVVNNPEMFRCDRCDKNFTHNLGLVHHMKDFHSDDDEEHDNNVAQDNPSNQMNAAKKKRLELTRIDEESIRRHVKYVCEQCGVESETFSQFVKHALEVHENSSAYLACCGKRFYKTVHLWEHVQLANNPDLYRCDRCEKKFNQKLGLQIHLEEFHSENMENLRKMEDDYIREHVKYACEMCGEDSPSFAHFRKHSVEVHDISNVFVVCCGKNYASRLNLLKHVRSIKNLNVVHCNACKKNFSTAYELRKHMKENHSSSGNKGSYAIRMKSRKGVSKMKWICEKCSKGFPTSRSLNQHMKVGQHAGKLDKYSCRFCAKKFRSKPWFQLHMQKHRRTNNRPQRKNLDT